MSDHEEKHGGGEHGDSHGGGGGHGGGGHGPGGHEEHHEGAPEWLISFADNVALIMGFFVILLAMNMGPKADPKQGGAPSEDGKTDGGQSAQALDMIIAIREGFNQPVSMKSTDPKEAALRKRIMERQGNATTDGPRGNNDKQQAPRPSDFDRVTAAISFDDRASKLTDEARSTIAEVAAKQRDQRWVLEVRGHTSPFEAMHNPTKALDLSYERAKAVAAALVESGMKWEAIRVVGMGDSDRVVARTFDRQQDRNNQRVEIVITNYPIANDPYAAPND